MTNFTNSFSLSQSAFSILYQKYKPFFLPVVSIVVCILIVGLFGTAQLQQYLEESKQREQIAKNISQLNDNLVLLSNISPQTAQEQFTTAISAIPAQKEYVGVLNSIAYAAAVANVSVSDFSFIVGDVAASPVEIKSGQLPSISVKLSLLTDEAGGQHFLQALSETLPLSRVNNIALNKNAISLDVSFYYKPFTNTTIPQNASLTPLTSQQSLLLQTLSEWQNHSTAFPQASSAATQPTPQVSPPVNLSSSASAVIAP